MVIPLLGNVGQFPIRNSKLEICDEPGTEEGKQDGIAEGN
jgi:hypothetical protein